LVLAFCAGVLSSPSLTRAQKLKGIPSEGRDFYIGYMPNLPIPNPPEPITPEQAYIIVCSEVDGNTFSISYFGDDGKEISGSSQALMKGRCAQIPLVKTYMAPKRPGEILEFKAAHVTSRFPVSVAVYQDGSAAGGMYEAIPTGGLGKSYVISTYYDVPLQDNPTPPGFADSASSEFLIIATADNTNVVFVPNSTTIGGVIGMNSGDGSTGKPHPTRITMRRGQVYWVRSDPNSALNDLTGSTVDADKPIAVLGGHEKALLGDPGAGVSQWADVRDILVEEMTPVEAWDSEYVSIPFLPAQSSQATSNGWGDLYRVVTNTDNNGTIDAYTCDLGSPGCTPVEKPVGGYQSPATDFTFIENPEQFIVKPGPDGKRKKMYAVQYDYFQGDNSTDEYAYTAPNEMNVVGLSRMITSTVFHIPQNSKYQGAQFINVITRRDSLVGGKIQIMIDGKNPTSLYSFPRMKTYNIPNHPELIGFTSRVGGNKDYMFFGNTPFACYSYGRTENTIKVSPWGYATPTAQLYGAFSESNPPRADVTPSCDRWDVRVYDTRPKDEGISTIMLLNDPNGIHATPARVSTNVTLSPSDPHFTPGDTSVSFLVMINDTRKDAYAALFLVDRAGNDTVIDLYYTAPRIAYINSSDTSLNFKNATVGMPMCSTVAIRVVSTGNTDIIPFTVGGVVTLDTVHTFDVTSTPASGGMLHVGDTVLLNICFTTPDTLKHDNAFLPFGIGCLFDTIRVKGNGVTPIMIASDWDFGNVPVGTTSAPHAIQIQNVGNGDLVLNKNWSGLSNPDFTFVDAEKLPITIKPHESDKSLTFTFHPSVKGPSDTRIDWGTNLFGKFAHQIKDTSHLAGFGIEPGLNWDRPKQQFTVKCESADTERINLINPSAGTTGSAITISSVKVLGPDAAEFKIVANEKGYMPLESTAPWPLDINDSIWVDVQFKADLSKGYVNRAAWIVASGKDGADRQYTDTMRFIGIVTHSDLAIDPPSYDYGSQDPGQQYTHSFAITNTGDADFVFNNIDVTGSDFKIISGLQLGDHLKPGETDTIVIQYNSLASGGISHGGFGFHDDICSAPTIAVKGNAGNMLVSDTGRDFALNFVCHNNVQEVAGTNYGNQYWGVLDSIEIVNAPGHMDADQFQFADDASHVKLLHKDVQPGGVERFPIKFTPKQSGPASALVIFHWVDTSKGRHLPITHIDTLVGVGYNTANKLSVKNPVANADYSTTTAGSINVPVQLTSAFADTAQVYGAKFTIRFLRDQFRMAGTVTSAMAGVSVQGNPLPADDPANQNYSIIPVEVHSTAPITSAGTLVNVPLQYLLAKDTTTEFQIQDLIFLDRDYASACWVASDIIPAQFFGLNLCGDKTLRIFLRSGGKAISNIRIANPIRRMGNLEFDVEEYGTPVTIEVFNALGQKMSSLMENEVHDKGSYFTTVDGSEFPSGMYTIRIATPGCEIMKSVLLNK